MNTVRAANGRFKLSSATRSSQLTSILTTIGGLIKDTSTDDHNLAIPDFLGDVRIKKPSLNTSSLGLYCSKTPNTAGTGIQSNKGICFVMYGMNESPVFTFT